MLILMCLISCLFGFANVQPIDQLRNQENNVQYVESKSSRNRVKTGGGFYEYGTTDLFNIYFLEGLINYYVEDLGYSEMSAGNDTPYQVILPTRAIYSIWYYDIANRIYDPIFDVYNIVFEKFIVDDGMPRPFLYYTLSFANSSPYDKQIQISFYAQRTNQNQLTIWGVNLNVSPTIDDIHSAEYWYTSFMLSEYGNNMSAFIGNIYNSFLTDEYNNGYQSGYSDGYNNAVVSIENDPLNDVYQDIYGNGYQTGYAEGYATGLDTDSTALTIMTGIVEVGLLPINVFLKMFEYEVFGINIAGVVSGLFTIAVVVIVIRMITGKKND